MSDNADFANARLTAANNWFQEEIKRLRLTDAEREAIAWFAEVGKPLARLTQSHNLEQYRATLRGLLERTDHT
jgi:hypothetical protein